MFKLQESNDAAETFLKQWRDKSEWIEARTSGSTGAPKVIRLRKSDMRRSALATNSRFGIDRDSVLASALSANYIAGKMMLVRAMEASCRIVMAKPKTDIGDLIDRHIDLLAVVPAQCEALLQNPSADLSNVIIGGAPISSQMELKLSAMPWELFATYGMTETCSHVALRRLGSDTYEAMPGITFSTDSRACLVIEAPEFSFVKLTTNDVVNLCDSTSFKWLGRYDNVINSGGVKFYPEELEHKLHGHIPFPFYLTAAPHHQWGECVVMVAQFIPANADESKRCKDEMYQICSQLLPRYAVPKEFYFVAALPCTSNGKLKRILPKS